MSGSDTLSKILLPAVGRRYSPSVANPAHIAVPQRNRARVRTFCARVANDRMHKRPAVSNRVYSHKRRPDKTYFPPFPSQTSRCLL